VTANSKTLLRRLKQAQVAADRQLLERKAAAEQAAIQNEDKRAAEVRWWKNWMNTHRPDGLDPLHDWFEALAAHTGPKVVEPRDARREAQVALGREPTAEEFKPFFEDVALENEFQSKYGRGPTWLEYVARFGRAPCYGRGQHRTAGAARDQQ
jgi:hypothetical protein